MTSTLIALVLQIVTGIYQLESSSGRAFDPCSIKGMYSGYGYASNRVCFASHAEAQAVVADWVERRLIKGYTVPQLLCEYQSGKRVDSCDYYQHYLRLKK